MDELEKVLQITAKGAPAERALAAFRHQLETWRVALPPTQPLVLDFGLGNLDAVGLIECWIANELEAGYCGKYLFILDGQTCPTHWHQKKHETFHVVKGRARVIVDGVAREMREGDVLPVPPGQHHSFTGLGPALLLELSTPCVLDDNYFENTTIPIGGNYERRFEIRGLDRSDAPRLLAFYNSLSEEVHHVYRPFQPLSELVLRTHLEEAADRKHLSFGLVDAHGGIWGHSFLLWVNGPKPVFGIGLHQDVHGRGWGRKMMQLILDEADAAKLPLVTLTVGKKNVRAQALYQKMGFEIKGEATLWKPNDEFYMERKH